MSGNRFAESVNRAQYPGLRDDIGEDPARFLDHDLHQDENMKRLALARIKGIDTIEKIEAWRAVERNLDRETRDQIINELDQRRAILEEIGERPDRLEFGPFQSAEDRESESDQETSDEPRTAHEKLQRLRADGGDPDA